MSTEVGKYRLVGFLSCFYLLMLRDVDLIDIVGWEIFYIPHLFIIQPIISRDTGAVDFFGRCQNSHPMLSLFFATG